MNAENIPTLVKPKIKNKDKLFLTSEFIFVISLKVKGINIIQTKTHLKKASEYGGTFSVYANLPIVKFPAQNNVARINIIYAFVFLLILTIYALLTRILTEIEPNVYLK